MLLDPQAQAVGDSVREQQSQQMKEMDDSAYEADIPILLPTGEQFQSVGEILSSIRPGHPLPVSGLDGGSSRTSSKLSGSNSNVKRSAFWGRNNVSCSYYLILLSCSGQVLMYLKFGNSSLSSQVI